MAIAKDEETLEGVLRDYEQDKFAIAAILRSAVATESKKDDWQVRAEQVFARLAEDRFNLVCVGRFSRGKTSLMNAILGAERLPTGIIPLTSVITSVTYGPDEKVVLRYQDRILPREVPLDALTQYITQDGNPGNIQRIKTAEVDLRADILRRGFHFIDTPGLGSAIAENTETTEMYLPEGDAFLIVTSYDSPLSNEEMRVMQAAVASGRRIFVVLNKHDTVDLKERGAALDYVGRHLISQFGDRAPPVFSISASEAIAAKRKGDLDGLRVSGVAALEEELIGFLLADKRTEFLLRTCDRVAALISELPQEPKVSRLASQIQVLAEKISKTHSRAAKGSPKKQFSSTSEGFRPCEICARVVDAEWDFLRRYQYDLSVSRDEQTRFAERDGFCCFHTWQYASLASPRGVSVSYSRLLDRFTARLRHLADAEDGIDTLPVNLRGASHGQEDCILCEVTLRAECNALAAVQKRLETEEERTLDALSAICLPHLQDLCDALKNRRLITRLLRRHAIIVERLSEDMQRYVLKRDGIRRTLENKDEESSASRALLLLAGHRNINFDRKRR
ncbi:MAG: dynamin family protein [Proteobacteria bacterium]|nr:dynamin family protein [Pseudomonadota bacterium]